MKAAVIAALAVLSGCESSKSLNTAGCLPLEVPADVVLLQDAGLFRTRENGPFLFALPRDTTNDAFSGTEQLQTLPAGTTLAIRDLKQHHGFDVGKGRISAFGTTPGGERFEYGWGGGTQIGRAPWEPASTPNLRTVDCPG